MQVNVGSATIDIFRVGLECDIYNRKFTFQDLSTYNGSSGSGRFSVIGISFLLKDQEGVNLATIDFTDASKYIVPGSATEFEVDLSQLSYPFIFQTYSIQAAIKDQGGTVYYTPVYYKKICQPQNLTESGYVPGIFQVTPNCLDNVLTIKELTPLVYNNETPAQTTKSGTLSYPTGTISAISFTGTPFSNNVIYTGQYRIVCTTVSEYDLDDDVNVLVTYSTNNVFDVTCANKIGDLMCCLVDLQSQYLKNCTTAVGKAAKQKLDEIMIPFLIGLGKEINGQDASSEATIIKKALNCDCGATSMRQNEFTPINAAATNIVLTGVGGTTIPSPTIVGNTKSYGIASNVYQVVKGDTNDLGFSIEVDNTTTYLVKYKITLNYSNIASSILNAIGANPGLIAQLNALITSTGNVSITGLDGKCVIDLSSTNYLLTQGITGSTILDKITVGGITIYNVGIAATNTASIQTLLNGLGIGTFSVSLNGNTLSILSLNNVNSLTSVTFINPNLVVAFQKTNITLVAVLQAIVDYLCELTSAQVALYQSVTLWQVDYNGIAASQSFGTGDTQNTLNQGIANSIYNIVQWISTLTGITCAKIAAVFVSSPNVTFGANARMYGTDGAGSCIGWNDKQIAELVIAAIKKYSDVLASYCEIDCEAAGTCPEITDINLGLVGSNDIGIYGVSFSSAPAASQTLTVKYKKTGELVYTTATNALIVLPNGNIQTSPPYIIPNPVEGETYNIFITNNCGGVGFIKTIDIPNGSVFTTALEIGNILYLMCNETAPTTIYTGSPFGNIGQILYTNAGLTVPLTGYAYVEDPSGAIWTVNSSTGELLTDTGLNCNTGTSNVILLGNNTGTICNTEVATGYTNGAFVPGGTLYSDSGLTTPVTGYSYVVNTANNQIYAINSVTGIIGAATGISCTSYASSYRRSNSEGTICTDSLETLYSAAVFAVGVTMYTDAALTVPATGYQFLLREDTYVIYNLNSATGVVGAATGNTCA